MPCRAVGMPFFCPDSGAHRHSPVVRSGEQMSQRRGIAQDSLPDVDPVAEALDLWREALRQFYDGTEYKAGLASRAGMKSTQALSHAIARRRGHKIDLHQLPALLLDERGRPAHGARALVELLARLFGCELVSVLEPDAEDVAAVLPEVCARNGRAGEAVLAQIHEAARGNARKRTLRARPRRADTESEAA